MHMNLVDLGIVAFLVFYVAIHIGDGFLYLSRKLVGFLGGAILAFLWYPYVSAFAAPHIDVPASIVDAGSFLVLFMLVQLAVNLLLGFAFSFIPVEAHESKASRALATIPALVDGLIMVSLLLFVVVASPFFISAKGPIEDSTIGSALVNRAAGLEVYLDQVFGKATQETLGFLTVKPEEGETVELPYKANDLRVDPQAEAEMLVLVNAERAKVGAPALVMDEKLVAVARLHSEDMWKRQYFAHVDPDGKDPFDRMRAGGVAFVTAGENLALARTTERAHVGLMNSPGHKRNILDPAFRKIGIGVIDGGIYGKMFTQNFSN